MTPPDGIHDDLDNDDRDDRDDREDKGIIPDTIRKALVSGLSAVLMTEEGIRGAFSDMRLPKDAVSYVVSQTEKSRRELFRVVSDELKGFLSNIDLTGEMRRAMTGLKVKVNAEITFHEADGGAADQGIKFDASIVDARTGEKPVAAESSEPAAADVDGAAPASAAPAKKRRAPRKRKPAADA